MNNTLIGAVAVIVASLLWSLDGFLRQSLYSLPPAVVVFWEHVFGFVVLLPIIIFTLQKFRSIRKNQWKAIALVSFLSGALGTVLYTAALGKIQFISFSVVVLLQQLQPLFAIVAAAILLREPINRRFIRLAAVALVAAYFISFPDLKVASAASGMVVAALMALGAAASWGASTAFSKYALENTSFLHITAIRFGLTPIFALLFVLVLGQQGSFFALSAPQWWTIITITFSTGLVALTIYYFGLKRIPASRSTLLELTWPLSAAITGHLFLGDRLTVTQWLGAVILVIVMWLVERDAQAIAVSNAVARR
ncbi:MAG: DMT family transporter [Candidatus Andersenbacteria bacterium]|nr:DMT family transporter [Candidatus Andersenbacteria bacterium]MBI3251218.1 DMT family transporter [Candidatus Andersenbacteria bacterium]